MTIYQVEDIKTCRINTTDCRELLADILRTRGEYRILISRDYVIENSNEKLNGDGFYLELESPSTELEYSGGYRTHWTKDSYIDVENYISCEESLVRETMEILDVKNTIELICHGKHCYLKVQGNYDLTKVLLLVTMMLIYSETPWIKSLDEYFSNSLVELEKYNSQIEPTHYKASRFEVILILYYLYKNKLKYSWEGLSYKGIDWFPEQLHKKYETDFRLFRNFIIPLLTKYDLGVTIYFDYCLRYDK